MKKTIRIVSATVHNNTNEVEIIIEKTTEEGINQKETLSSIWIDIDEKLNK